MEIFNTSWKVLIPIFNNPTYGLTIREISRLVSISHPTVSKIVKRLEKNDLVMIEKRKREMIIKGNLNNEMFIELKKIYNMLNLKGFVKDIVKLYPIDVIICFGSYSLGIDTENSDIDIYIGFKKIEVNQKFLEKWENKLKRKIQIFSGNLKKFPKELAENIINGTKLYGWIKLW